MTPPIIGIIASSVQKASTAFESIATLTATGGETSLTFSSIPGTYKALQIRGIAKDTSSTFSFSVGFRFNGDTATNYTFRRFSGDGTSAVTAGAVTENKISSGAAGSAPSTGSHVNMYGGLMVEILDYASTVKQKTLRGFAGTNSNSTATDQRMSLFSGLWVSTSAITSVTMLPAVTSFAAGTKFALYGIKG